MEAETLEEQPMTIKDYLDNKGYTLRYFCELNELSYQMVLRVKLGISSPTLLNAIKIFQSCEGQVPYESMLNEFDSDALCDHYNSIDSAYHYS